MAVVQLSALHGKGNLETHLAFPLVGKEIGRAGDALLDLAFHRTIVYIDQHQAVGVGMGPDLEHLAHDDLFPIPPITDIFDRSHLKAGERQALGQLIERHRNIHILLKPAYGYSHCSILLSRVIPEKQDPSLVFVPSRLISLAWF